MTIEEDNFLWLEELEDKNVESWANRQSNITEDRLSKDPRFSQVYDQFEEVYTTDERLPNVVYQRGYVYNLWQDSDHPRGIYRRTSMEDFKSDCPGWEVLLDVDALAERESVDWYLQPKAVSFSPSGRRLLMPLTPGGKDALTFREFDIEDRCFVEDGFITPLAKQTSIWCGDDCLLVSIALGKEEKTIAGYPATLRLWNRGNSLSESPIVYEVDRHNMSLNLFSVASARRIHSFVFQVKCFSDVTVLSVDDQGKVTPLDLPGNISMSGITVIDDQLVVPIQERWHVGSRSFEKGSVVAFDLKKALAEGGCIESAALVYEPSDGEAIPAFGCYSGSKNAYYLNVLKDVSSRVIRCTPRILKDQDWQSSAHDLPGFGTAVLPDRNNPDVDSVLFTYDSITTPPAYYLLDASGEIELIKKEPGLVNLDGYKTVQRFALSKDGIRIPYFVTHAKDIVMDGSNPVIMSAYGAFGVSHTCQYHNVYLGAVPHLWLQRGGVYVTVNPRGGGEYGPDWQEAAKQDERQNSYDDIYCVVEDMIKTGITSSGKVGAIYGSNGGLMTGVVCTQRPDLFGAGISLVPLLDMLRFHKLLAGASWIDEYGDPDISKDVEYLRSYSPYHNIFPGKSYPEIFFMTSTTDDRVHPGHARKMAAKMQEQGHSCLFYEATAGGHAMAVTPQGRAHNSAMQLVYFMLKLMDRCEIFP